MKERLHSACFGAFIGLLLSVPGFFLGLNASILVDKILSSGTYPAGPGLEVICAICGVILPPALGGLIGLAVGSRIRRPHGGQRGEKP
jgi:hypothetical protein